MKRIGLFGGSFDPVHNGHVEAVKSFLNSGFIDEVWILLTPDPPHKSGQVLNRFEHRLEMLKLAFRSLNRVKISQIETELPKPSYTLRTIEHLKNRYPDHLFYLCLGEDSLQTFHQWYKYREIIGECSLIVVDRPGADHSEVAPEILEETIFVEHQPQDISSTEIRSKPGSRVKRKLPADVQAYIQKNNLYIELK
ncbi:nicotinate (nicotinamide) nucleotide adenylyltransferase [Rhodohalobacter halophilus]|uniref:nicotinate (nicotinamide) nucleotide adenylyltransferase n=1 Tax=Rhodohalobacter halophilus TaxID=1812810 RepID=UPI00083F94CD|nr:nicotinate (nicotinamide) nucleotide adenylyltransferase [Rhodohalobacter halophilus]